MTLVVRRLDPADWEVYRQVRLAALAESPEAFSSTLEREQELGEDLWRSRLGSAATFLAWRPARRARDPVGTATGIADHPGEEHSVPGARQLVGMWVAPRARASGVADLLVEAVAGHAAESGAPCLVLWVVEDNLRARAFYSRRGFGYTGARQLVRPDEPGRFELQMRRDLAG